MPPPRQRAIHQARPTAAAAQPAAADQQDVQRYNQLMRAQERKSQNAWTRCSCARSKLMDKQEAAFTRFQKNPRHLGATTAQYQNIWIR